jgi:hypothetical protein
VMFTSPVDAGSTGLTIFTEHHSAILLHFYSPDRCLESRRGQRALRRVAAAHG